MYVREESMDEYLTLVRAFPLVSIKDDAQLDAALTVFEPLFTQPQHSAAQQAYIEALADLIEIYESAHHPIRQPAGVDVVAYLMAEHGLQQKDMDFVFGNKSVTSAVLSGKRPLSLRHARRLSERFHLPLDVFLTEHHG
jgi:HTH-type transcriptional regulator/antitoxin HigA